MKHDETTRIIDHPLYIAIKRDNERNYDLICKLKSEVKDLKEKLKRQNTAIGRAYSALENNWKSGDGF
jgi:hypothetical protein